MKKLLIFGLLLFLGLHASAQLNDAIKRASDDNASKSGKSSSSSGNDDASSDSGNDSGDATSSCISGCLDAAFSECFTQACAIGIDALGKAMVGISNFADSSNTAIKAKEYDMPRINSLNVTAEGGFTQIRNSDILLRARLNGPIAATDARYFVLFERKNKDTLDTYSTFDWQILMLNLCVQEHFNLRIGSGFMHENYSGQFFNEHTAMVDVYFLKNAKLSVEGRIAPDYSTSVYARSELNAGICYTFRNFKYATIGIYAKYMRQNYYEKVSFGAGQIGLEFQFKNHE